MLAVIVQPVTIDEQPRNVGEIVEVACPNTFRNLCEDGRIKPAPEDGKPFADASAKSPKLSKR